MNARVGRHCEVFFLAAVLFPLRLCLYKEDACWARRHIRRFYKAFRNAAWFRPSADLLHIAGMSQKHPHANTSARENRLRPDTTEPASYLFDVDVLFRTRLKQVDPHLLRKLLRVSRLDHLGVGVVVFVSHWKMNIAKGDSTRATWETELRAILPQNRRALDSRVESIFRSRMARWRQSPDSVWTVKGANSPNIRHTSSQFWLISCSHRLTLTKDSALVTSYTTMTPCVPL